MGKSRKKKLKTKSITSESKAVAEKTPFKNLPDKFLWMQMKCGTKMRNVLKYAMQHFANYDTMVWTAAGSAIGRAISCVEIFKRQNLGLHQLTKLRYISDNTNKVELEKKEPTLIPEIHILLTKNIQNTKEPGYQAPDDAGNFPIADNKRFLNPKDIVPGMVAKEFEAMGLRIGQKRTKKDYSDGPLSKVKRKQLDRKEN